MFRILVYTLDGRDHIVIRDSCLPSASVLMAALKFVGTDGLQKISLIKKVQCCVVETGFIKKTAQQQN